MQSKQHVSCTVTVKCTVITRIIECACEDMHTWQNKPDTSKDMHLCLIGLLGTNSFPIYTHDRGPSPQHQLQLVQLLPAGRPSLIVLPCSLLWTATAQKGRMGPPSQCYDMQL